MNLIARQSIKYSMLSYLGVAIGMFASIFLYPYDFAYMGHIRFLMSTATAIFPFILMGTAASMVKFYPQFDDQKGQLNLLYIALLTLVCNVFLVAAIYILWYSFGTIPYFINDIWESFPIILILSFFLALIQIGSKYVSNFGRIAQPVIYENLFPKIALLVSFCAFVFWGLERFRAVALFLIIIMASVIGLGFYISRFQSFKAQNPLVLLQNKKFTQSFYAFSAYSVLGGVGSVLASQIDLIMIREMISSYETGLYATMLSITGLMVIPYYAVNSISGPIISNTIYEEKWEELKNLYQKVSKNLYFLGSFMFCIMLAAAPSLFSLMKNGSELQEIFPVLYILGAATVFDLMTGFNSQIIAYSRYYRFTLLVTVILAFVTIGLNFYFIRTTSLGVMGVALATCISLVLFNLSKMLFIGISFKIWPFSHAFLQITFVLAIGLALALYLPDSQSDWLDIIYKPMLIVLWYFIGNQFVKFIDWKNIITTDWKKILMG